MHWGLRISAFYLVALLVLALPVIYLAFLPQVRVAELGEMYVSVVFWIYVGIVLLGQWALLLIPVRRNDNKSVGRMHISVTVATTGLLFGLLVLTLGMTLAEVIFQAKGPGNSLLTGILVAAVVSWLLWAAMFWQYTRNHDADAMVTRATAWLLRGSVLELLIALPSHIYMRGKTYCCAGFLTFTGLVTGLSIMLIAFGPAVFVLYRDRVRRKRAEH